MQKGISYSTVVILALLGILLVSIWSYSQLSSGAQYAGTYSSRTSQDIAVSRLELAKRFLTQNLVFSSQAASLAVAANGGTQFPNTYWYCGGQPTPPQLSEVQAALSNQSLNLLNSYVSTIPDSELAKAGIQVSNYGCTAVYDPGQINCMQQDSTRCEGFQTTGTNGGTIQVTTPSAVQYNGDITADNTNNRFFWMYYKLYDDTMKNGLPRALAAATRASCNSQNCQGLLNAICQHYETLLAEPDGTKYVQCQTKVVCTGSACLNTPCDRPPVQPVCQKSTQAPFDEKTISSFLDSLGGKIVSAQCAQQPQILDITLTDTKFNIPSDQGLQPLVWDIHAVEPQPPVAPCRPVDAGLQ